MMREVQLPAQLRVGQGYGKVSLGGAHDLRELHGLVPAPRDEQLYAAPPEAALVDLAELAGAKVVSTTRAAGSPRAIHCARSRSPKPSRPRSRPAARPRSCSWRCTRRCSPRAATSNFWESGWLHHQIERWRPYRRQRAPDPQPDHRPSRRHHRGRGSASIRRPRHNSRERREAERGCAGELGQPADEIRPDEPSEIADRVDSAILRPRRCR